MPRPLNTRIDVRVQVIDANSDPATGASVTSKSSRQAAMTGMAPGL